MVSTTNFAKGTAMLTYDLNARGKTPLYEYLYSRIKSDILSGTLAKDTRLPSKRAFAAHLGISMITVENAYGQLLSEGYIYSLPKKGFFVADTEDLAELGRMLKERRPEVKEHFGLDGFAADSSGSCIAGSVRNDSEAAGSPLSAPLLADFTGAQSAGGIFPFATWAKLMRETISEKNEALMEKSETQGSLTLRRAIADHLRSFRGMDVDPACIIIGAGTEYLYGLLLQLLGRDRSYCIEDPGYRTISKVYNAGNAHCVYAPMDEYGLRSDVPDELGAEILHISPNHQFPTGITMPVTRRYELLRWANEAEGRYIIEDDYDSEFRLTGRPIPSMFSIDNGGRVIYMNTFSKTLAHTIRISYMILPAALMRTYREKLGFYSCTVSTFEQYTLAKFIGEGYFEKHINRSRIYYTKKRDALIAAIKNSPLSARAEITQADSGLHFLIRFSTGLSDAELSSRLQDAGILIRPLSRYYVNASAPSQIFVCSYAGIETGKLAEIIGRMEKIISCSS